MFSEIEKIYMEQAKISIDDMTLEKRMAITKKAYEWCERKSKDFDGSIFGVKDRFLEFLSKQDLWKNCYLGELITSLFFNFFIDDSYHLDYTL